MIVDTMKVVAIENKSKVLSLQADERVLLVVLSNIIYRCPQSSDGGAPTVNSKSCAVNEA